MIAGRIVYLTFALWGLFVLLAGCAQKLESDGKTQPTDVSGGTVETHEVDPSGKNAPPTTDVSKETEKSMNNVQVQVDLGKKTYPLLFKKFSQFNSGLVPLENYRRDWVAIDAVDADSLRIDLGIGAKGFPLRETVTGTAEAPVYDFSTLDALAGLINERDVLPYFAWCYMPIPVQNLGDHRSGPTDEKAFQRIYAMYAKHCRESGIRIGYHEIYNEPDLFNVFYAKPFSEYLKVYEAGVKGIREGDPDAVVGGPALAMPEIAENTSSFLEMVAGKKLPLDFFSYHHYWKNGLYTEKYNTVRNLLAQYDCFRTTEIHLNEAAYVSGWIADDENENNFFGIAPDVFKMMAEVLNQPDITVVSWAQFLESTVLGDAYGMIFRDGRKKALYNAFKIYADLPEDRVALLSSNPVMDGFAGVSEEKAGILIWNTGVETYKVDLLLNGDTGRYNTVRLYRINRENASALDGGTEDLVCLKQSRFGKEALSGIEVGADETLYVTLHEDDQVPDFDPSRKNVNFSTYVRSHYLFVDRFKNNHAYLDRKAWRADLGMGENLYARSCTGVSVEDLPDAVKVRTESDGIFSKKGELAHLSIRFDFPCTDGTRYAVDFCPEGWETPETIEFPWGRRNAANQVITVPDFKAFTIAWTDLLPEKCDRTRAIITFDMQDAGPGSAITFRLSK